MYIYYHFITKLFSFCSGWESWYFESSQLCHQTEIPCRSLQDIHSHPLLFMWQQQYIGTFSFNPIAVLSVHVRKSDFNWNVKLHSVLPFTALSKKNYLDNYYLYSTKLNIDNKQNYTIYNYKKLLLNYIVFFRPGTENS